ncbi:hypothetical protein [Cloacibacillus evryensis]|uniref:hypothetical protein n=1 Tax=Cloacibacillus evryensis TaxID=508460 RepID=UPI002B1FE8CA|nr:hypothetical protein [Cloacibacillus evryensis]MEA5034247.1 hypothetical protein [Cloacibacillus evryensis]
MDNALYDVFGGIMNRYGGTTMPSNSVLQAQQNVANQYNNNRLSNRYGYSNNTRLARENGGNFGLANRQLMSLGVGGYDRNGNYVGSSEAYDVNGNRVSTSQGAQLENAMTSNGKGTTTAANNSASNGSWLSNAFDTADYQKNLTDQNINQLLQDTPGYLQKADTTLDEARSAVSNANTTANRYYGDADEYMAMHKDLLNTGKNAGLEAYLEPLFGQVSGVYNSAIGSNFNNLASKGIINSSVANAGINSAQKNAADALVNGRMQGAELWLNQMLGGAGTASDLAKSVVANANTTASDLTNVANGYRSNYDSGINGLNIQTGLVPKYYENALAPLMPAYQFWQDSTNAWLGNDHDTVVTSNGK